jgi:hypothetical protein
VDVVNVATPLDAGTVVNVAVPSKNVIVPVALFGVTVAVNVTD